MIRIDYDLTEVGASDNPCSEIYAGPRAFSEVETKAIAEFLLSKRSQIKLYVALHGKLKRAVNWIIGPLSDYVVSLAAYSQLWLTPWGYTRKLPENYAQMVSLLAAIKCVGILTFSIEQEAKAIVAANALKARYGTEFRIGKIGLHCSRFVNLFNYTQYTVSSLFFALQDHPLMFCTVQLVRSTF